MAKDCGPSAALDKLNDTIASAKGTADGLIADATNGIATQVSGLASQISGPVSYTHLTLPTKA